MEEYIYSKDEVCNILGVTDFTLDNWYMWQNKAIKQNLICQEYLPRPIRIKNKKGQPRMWSIDMIYELIEYKESIVHGRNGKYGRFSNRRKENNYDRD